MRGTRLGAGALVALLLIGYVAAVAPAAPAGAASDVNWEYVPARISGNYQPLAGDFTGPLGAAAQDEILWYAPGDAADTLFTGAGRTFTSTHLTINGRYRPLVGDFAGDAHDDVLFYGPGGAADTLWVGGTGAAFPQSRITYTVNGDYRPVVLRDAHAADAKDRILWYAPGPSGDSEWVFAPDGDGGHSAVELTISGTYQPVVGFFGGDDAVEDVFFYAPGSAPDSLWTSKVGEGFTTSSRPVDGTYVPAVVPGPEGDGILWWADGPATDHYWRSGNLHSVPTQPFRETGTPYGSPLGIAVVAVPVGLEIALFEFEGRVEAVDLSPSQRDVGPETRPVQGDFDGDGGPDLFWYGQGARPDEVWYAELQHAETMPFWTDIPRGRGAASR
jgi:hypothetical protein